MNTKICISKFANKAMFEAIVNGDESAVKEAILSGADIHATLNVGPYKGRNAWWLAAAFHRTKLAGYFLEHGVETPKTYSEMNQISVQIKEINPISETPPVIKEFIQKLMELIKQDTHYVELGNLAFTFPNTATHNLIAKNIYAIKQLKMFQAEKNRGQPIRPIPSWNYIHFAAALGDPVFFEFLEKNEASINGHNLDPMVQKEDSFQLPKSPLTIALENNNLYIANRIITHPWFIPNTKSKKEYEALTKLEVENKVPMNCGEEKFRRLWLLRLAYSHLTSVFSGDTPAHFAATYDIPELINICHDAQASLDAPNQDYLTPMLIAYCANHKSVVDRLTAYGMKLVIPTAASQEMSIQLANDELFLGISVNTISRVVKGLANGAQVNELIEHNGKYKGKSYWWMAMSKRQYKIADLLVLKGFCLPSTYKEMQRGSPSPLALCKPHTPKMKEFINKLEVKIKEIKLTSKNYFLRKYVSLGATSLSDDTYQLISEYCKDIPQLEKFHQDYSNAKQANFKNGKPGWCYIQLAAYLGNLESLTSLYEDGKLPYHGNGEQAFEIALRLKQDAIVYHIISNHVFTKLDAPLASYLNSIKQQYPAHYRFCLLKLAYDNLAYTIDEQENTVLHFAVQYDHLDLVTICGDGGVSLASLNKAKQTPLMLAASLGRKEIAIKLIEFGAIVDEYSQTTLISKGVNLFNGLQHKTNVIQETTQKTVARLQTLQTQLPALTEAALETRETVSSMANRMIMFESHIKKMEEDMSKQAYIIQWQQRALELMSAKLLEIEGLPAARSPSLQIDEVHEEPQVNTPFLQTGMRR